jgi:exopolysaccharide biosynthesis polyprenyl glycosylphosphotransferase
MGRAFGSLPSIKVLWQVNIQSHFESWKETTASQLPKRWLLPGASVRLQLQLLVAFIDMMAILGGLVIGNLVRFDTPFAAEGLSLFGLGYGLFLAYALAGGAYHARVILDRHNSVSCTFMAFVKSVGTVVFTAFFLKQSEELSRLVFGVGVATGGALLLLGRLFFQQVIGRRHASTILAVLVICDKVRCRPEPGSLVVDAEEMSLSPDINDPIMLDRLGRFVRGADRVIVACRDESRLRWVMALKGANIIGEIVTPELNDLGALGTARYNKETTMVVSTGPLSMRDRLLKRTFDLSVAIGALIIVAPLIILVCIAIKLDSKGPIFFIQERMGQGNRLFNMYKFRSMRAEACDAQGRESTGLNDNRVTRVGRFIRSTSIDELPQIFNILLGDMSLVGPRPHALGSTAGDKLFWEVDARYWHRHACKPGLTGLAQVRGLRGATNSRRDLTDRLQADLEYLSGWSIWRDLAILFATVRVVVHHRAY